MSPQIVDGTQRYTYKTDIWSLGVIYYELLTGSMPFSAEKMTELARNMGTGLYLIQMPYRPCMETLHVITSCLNQNEDERISIEELAEYPFFFDENYSPHYMNESSREGSSVDRSSMRSTHKYRSNSGGINNNRGRGNSTLSNNGVSSSSFKMVLNSKDSTFTRRLNETLSRGFLASPRGETMTTTIY